MANTAQDLEATACQVWEHLRRQPEGAQSAMHLKLALEISASKLFLALGWLLREGRVSLETGEHGFIARCQEGAADPLIR